MQKKTKGTHTCLGLSDKLLVDIYIPASAHFIDIILLQFTDDETIRFTLMPTSDLIK